MLLIWPLISALLLLASLASYSWAMRKFFTKPSGDTAGMRIIRIASTVFALVHLIAILSTPNATARQALTGAAVYFAGFALFFWALRAHGRRPLSAAFSPDQPAHLVDWGPYRYIRHPFYSAYLLTWTAGVVATGRLALVLSVVMMVWIYLRAAQTEEKKFAQSPLAPLYARYKRVTGMFLPSPYRWIKRRGKEADAAGVA